MIGFVTKNKSTKMVRRHAYAIVGLRTARRFLVARQIPESTAIGLRRMTLSEEAKDQIIDVMNREPDQKLSAREMPTVDASHLLRKSTEK